MKESMWGYAVIVLGVLAIAIIWFFANVTKTDQHNYNLLKETVEASMEDSLDLATYRLSGIIKIDKEKFVENFIRRFAENADLSNKFYQIDIFDINETPPKVSVRVSSTNSQNFLLPNKENQTFEFDIVNNIDMIIESVKGKNDNCTVTNKCDMNVDLVSLLGIESGRNRTTKDLYLGVNIDKIAEKLGIDKAKISNINISDNYIGLETLSKEEQEQYIGYRFHYGDIMYRGYKTSASDTSYQSINTETTIDYDKEIAKLLPSDKIENRMVFYDKDKNELHLQVIYTPDPVKEKTIGTKLTLSFQYYN